MGERKQVEPIKPEEVFELSGKYIEVGVEAINQLIRESFSGKQAKIKSSSILVLATKLGGGGKQGSIVRKCLEGGGLRLAVSRFNEAWSVRRTPEETDEAYDARTGEEFEYVTKQEFYTFSPKEKD